MRSIQVKHPNPNAHTRLYCFPFAGGNAQAFSHWHSSNNSDLEIVAVQYPGRSERFMEPAIGNCLSMAKAIAADINAAGDESFAILGYSMGGIIAYETLRYLEKVPKALFLCASHPPRTISRQRHEKDDAGLLEDIKKLGGVDERLLQDPEMRSLIIATMRSDFKLIDTYQAFPQQISCPTHVVFGAYDPHVTPQLAKQWGDLCKGTVHYHEIRGEHFFLRSHRDELLNYIHRHLSTAARCSEVS